MTVENQVLPRGTVVGQAYYEENLLSQRQEPRPSINYGEPGEATQGNTAYAFETGNQVNTMLYTPDGSGQESNELYGSYVIKNTVMEGVEENNK